MKNPRWQMLPGGLLEESGSKRSARDWIVDATMLAVALGVGMVSLGSTEKLHPSDELVFLYLVLGLLALVPLWWRRTHPLAVGLIALPPGVVSAFAAGAGLIALFNAVMHGSRRTIVIITALSVVV